jgi:hypothetical protein
MPRIPIQSLVSSRESGVDVQPGAFQATAQATANLMSSVSGAAQMVKQQFDRAQDLRNRTQLSEERRGLRDARGNFLNKMNGLNADGSQGKPVPPAQWGPLWKTELDAIKKGFEDSDMPPVVSRALAEDYENFAGSSYVQIAGAALKLNQREARQNFDRDLQHFVTEENWEEAGGLVKNARGYEITDGEADGLNKALGVGKRNADMATSLDADPEDHIKRINEDAFGRLAPSQKRKEIKKGELGMTKLEVEGVTFLQDMLEDGNYKNMGEFEVAIDEISHITPQTKKRLLRNFKSSAPISEGGLLYLQDKIDDLTKLRGNPEEYEAAWNKLKVELGTYRREDIGHFNTTMHLEAPQKYSKEANVKRTEKERQEMLAPLATVANELVKGRAAGIADIAQQKSNSAMAAILGDADPTNDQALQTTIGSSELKQTNILVRSALHKEMNKFIMDYIAEKGRNPTELEMKKFLDTDGDRIAEKAMGTVGGSLSIPGVAAPKKLEGANLAKDWLSPTTLPKNQ